MTVLAARPALIAFAAGVLAATPSDAWEIAPHRAIYELDLASARMGSQVSDVGGQMLFIWEDSCDGWTVEQRYRTNYVFAEGGEVEQRMTYATWESKDGRDFNFSVRNVTGDMADDEVRGIAHIATDGSGTVEFRLPADREERLPSGTLFPTAHTLRLLDEAELAQLRECVSNAGGGELDRQHLRERGRADRHRRVDVRGHQRSQDLSLATGELRLKRAFG